MEGCRFIVLLFGAALVGVGVGIILTLATQGL
jgi:hypothetical protein